VDVTKVNKRILIVDDEEIHRMGLRDRLEAAGYEVHSAEGGKKAIEIVQQMAFDLIVLDLLMPRPNGFEVFKCLKELSVKSRTPVLILTVVGLEPQVQELITDGAHHLQKREAPRKLVPKIKELIG
jgi:CheY-like chemotaxis protein